MEQVTLFGTIGSTLLSANQTFFLKILDTIIPFASGVFIFYLTSRKEKRISKNEVRRNRLNAFYIPYYQFYCKKLLNTNRISSFSYEQIYEVIELMGKNICNMGTKTQALYPELYLSYRELLLSCAQNANNVPSKDAADNFELIFTKVNDQVFAEYKDICHKLKLPAPAKEVLKRSAQL